MSAHQPLLGMPTHRPRHARPQLRWRSAIILLATAAVIGVADSSVVSIVLSVAVVVGVVIGVLCRRSMRAAAKLEEILESELAVREPPGPAGRL
ncbi:hypothetical protein [Amycolatopsis sp. NPDC003861]